jgi:cyclic dehypoxanthinyl futalosine synthase
MDATIRKILDKATAGERLTFAEGVELIEKCYDLPALGRAADAVCRRLHPEPYRTYNIDRNINYTNICAAVCDFCAFYRKSGRCRCVRAAARGAVSASSRRRSP